MPRGIVIEFNGIKGNLSYWAKVIGLSKNRVTAIYRDGGINAVIERITDYYQYGNCRKPTKVNIWKSERLRKIFQGMKRRCYNVNSISYSHYGGRGIKICKQWLDNPLEFEKWSYQNGYREQDSNIDVKDMLSIDRIDPDSDYCPENCRWISLSDNSSRSRAKIDVTFNGETHSLRQWAIRIGKDSQFFNSIHHRKGIEGVIKTLDFYLNKNGSSTTRGKMLTVDSVTANCQHWSKVLGKGRKHVADYLKYHGEEKTIAMIRSCLNQCT